jgi:integrase
MTQLIGLKFIVPDELLEKHIQDFLDAKAVRRPATVAAYETALRQYAAHVGANHWPPTESSINSFLAGVRRRGRKESTLYFYHSSLNTWLEWLRKRNRIDHNPMDLVERVRKPRPIPRGPDERDMAQLMRYLKEMAASGTWMELRNLAMLSLALDTGMREGEIAGLRERDIDLINRSIAVDTGSKTARARSVKFSTLAAGPLTDWLLKRRTLGIPENVGVVFVGIGGRYKSKWHPLTRDGIYQLLKRKLKQAGVGHIRFHSLRNGYAIFALRNGADIEDVRRQMGHTNLATTALYTLSVDRGRGERHEQHSPLLGLLGGDI